MVSVFTPGTLDLRNFLDAYWVGDPNDTRPTLGCVVLLGSSPISWSSTKQYIVEIVWINQLLMICIFHHLILLCYIVAMS